MNLKQCKKVNKEIYTRKVTTLKRAWRIARRWLASNSTLPAFKFWPKFLIYHSKELFSTKSIKFRDGLGLTYHSPVHNASSFITYLNGYRDYNVYMFYKKWLKPTDCAVDVGGNIGTHLLPIASLLTDEGVVIGYEVDCEVCSLLEQNCAKNDMGNVIIRCCAISDRGGVIHLNRNYINRGQTSVSHSGQFRGLVGNSVTLDDDIELLIKKREINLMKIDVEGHEAEVIRGAKDVLQRSKRIAVVMEHFEEGDNEAPQLLSDMGFSPFNANTTGDLEPATDGFGDNVIWVKNTTGS